MHGIKKPNAAMEEDAGRHQDHQEAEQEEVEQEETESHGETTITDSSRPLKRRRLETLLEKHMELMEEHIRVMTEHMNVYLHGWQALRTPYVTVWPAYSVQPSLPPLQVHQPQEPQQ